MILSDIDIDILNHNDIINNYLSLINQHGFIITVNYNTRSNNSGGSYTSIDHILIKTKSLNNSIAYGAHTTLTAHYYIILNVNDISNNCNNQPCANITAKS